MWHFHLAIICYQNRKIWSRMIGRFPVVIAAGGQVQFDNDNDMGNDHHGKWVSLPLIFHPASAIS
jgi:hypothetical protein